MVLVQVTDTDPVFVSTGVERRWVSSAKRLASLQKSIRAEGGKGVVTKIAADELDAYGELVGPLPTA